VYGIGSSDISTAKPNGHTVSMVELYYVKTFQLLFHKNSAEYKKAVADSQYLFNRDFIFSIFLLEHVPDNNKTFQNIINSLGPSGDSIHLFPLGFHPFSLLTKIVTNSFQKKLISLIRKNTIGITGYPTYYSLCSSFELKTYFSKHTEIEYKVKYLYGAEDYFGFFFPFGIGIHIFNRICNMFNLHIFASNAILTIHRK
jgi:hypothetical protein